MSDWNMIIHDPVRLQIMTLLAATPSANFIGLRETTNTTDGNLITHLRKLEQNDYIYVSKTQGRRTQSWYSITPRGLAELHRHLGLLEQVIVRCRGQMEGGDFNGR